jgi:hypothetical protein
LLCLGRPSLKQKNPPQNHCKKQQEDSRCSFVTNSSYHPDLELHHSIETKAIFPFPPKILEKIQVQKVASPRPFKRPSKVM